MPNEKIPKVAMIWTPDWEKERGTGQKTPGRVDSNERDGSLTG